MQIYISQPPPPPKKKTKKKTKQKTKQKTSKRKNKTKHNKTKTYLEFHYYPYDTERISMYMSPYGLLILLRAIGDFIRILIFIQHKKVSAGISIYNKKFISVFVKIF